MDGEKVSLKDIVVIVFMLAWPVFSLGIVAIVGPVVKYYYILWIKYWSIP